MALAQLSKYEPALLSLLRIVTGFTFTFHGVQKVFGLFGGRQFPFASLLGIAGYIELIGGTLIFVGLFTRPIAFVLAGLMAVAYFMQHARTGFLPGVNRGELAVLYCFIFLYLMAAGAGPWSVDGLIRRGKRPLQRAVGDANRG